MEKQNNHKARQDTLIEILKFISANKGYLNPLRKDTTKDYAFVKWLKNEIMESILKE